MSIYQLTIGQDPELVDSLPSDELEKHECGFRVPLRSYLALSPVYGVRIKKLDEELAVPLPCFVETKEELSKSDLTFGHLIKML